MKRNRFPNPNVKLIFLPAREIFYGVFHDAEKEETLPTNKNAVFGNLHNYISKFGKPHLLTRMDEATNVVVPKITMSTE